MTNTIIEFERQAIMAEEGRAQLGTYAKLPIVAERGQGIMLYDADGTEYYDFYCGHAVTITGHCHPRVVAAIQEQAARLIFYSNIVYNDVRARYAGKLMEIAPEGYGQVFFCNSGAEANETALKLSRKFTGRPTIIAMEGAFHGRTMGALAMTANPKVQGRLRAPLAGRAVRALGRPWRAGDNDEHGGLRGSHPGADTKHRGRAHCEPRILSWPARAMRPIRRAAGLRRDTDRDWAAPARCGLASIGV